jgi:cysteine-rich repeat protein
MLSAVSGDLNPLPGSDQSSLYMKTGSWYMHDVVYAGMPAPGVYQSIVTLVFHVMDAPIGTTDIVPVITTLAGTGGADFSGVTTVVPLSIHVGPVCGDGFRTMSEGCDDSNTSNGDGCDDVCSPEAGWTCVGYPSTCTEDCGDGTIVGSEGCDDGDTDPGDGCDASCQIETGWTCVGEPSVCELCGNGLIEGSEECDDGDTAPGDGCNASCQIEAGWFCVVEPSKCSLRHEGSLSISIGSISGGDLPFLPGSDERIMLLPDGHGGHSIYAGSNVVSSTYYGPGTSMFTGIPLISDIRFVVNNQSRSGTFRSGYTHTNFVGGGSVVGPYLGGELWLNGQMMLHLLYGMPTKDLPLGFIGGADSYPVHASTTILGVRIVATGGPWVTGPVSVTGITTNVISYNGVTGAAITMRLTSNQHPKVFNNSANFTSLDFHGTELS